MADKIFGIPVEDKTTLKYGAFVSLCLENIAQIIPRADLIGIERILLLDECLDKKYSQSGGFYRANKNGKVAFIELYPPVIIKAIPSFLPKLRFFKKYSIIRMFLHELGHHYCGIKDMEEREKLADAYMHKYLQKKYGKWNRFFYFTGDLSSFIDELKNL